MAVTVGPLKFLQQDLGLVEGCRLGFEKIGWALLAAAEQRPQEAAIVIIHDYDYLFLFLFCLLLS